MSNEQEISQNSANFHKGAITDTAKGFNEIDDSLAGIKFAAMQDRKIRNAEIERNDNKNRENDTVEETQPPVTGDEAREGVKEEFYR